MQKKMKAAVLKNFHMPLEIEMVDVPAYGRNEVLIQIAASALCVSDIHIQNGIIPTVQPPYIPGHEMAGIVVAVGSDVHTLKVGDRVIASIDIVCGHCRFCLSGKTNLCPSLKRIGFEQNGSHAEFCVAPCENVFKIGSKIPFEQAACLLDAVGCMFNAIKRQGNVHAGDRVLILGTGGLGMNAIQIAKLYGATVYATSRNPEKLKIATELGADGVINTKTQRLYDQIYSLSNRELCDVVIDNIGIRSSVNEALHLVRPGGKVLIAGYNDVAFEADFQDIMKFEKEIIGIRGVMRADIPEIIRFVEDGRLKPYVFKTMPFEKINEALQDMRAGNNYGRIVLTMPNATER